jgi:ADP-dependent NAD(P)H-hydrate dehydratase / NAD(P)H-hydrate epimerase
MANARPSSITQKQVSAFLKPRPKDSNKGMFGTITVIGGANGMVGAALLAGRAALKMGAGCVHVGMLADNAPVVDLVQPELMLHSAGDALKRLPHPALSRGERVVPPSPPGRGIEGEGNVLVIGCGLGHSLAAQKLLYNALLLDRWCWMPMRST